MAGSLIPNADFSYGLQDWECTPSGVTLVEASGKRFVMLAGVKSPAAICSDPIEVVPNAAYRLWAEKAIRGDVSLSMISRSAIVAPDGTEEVVPQETPVRIQVTSDAGKRAAIAKVVFEPVGRRLRLESLRSTALFANPGDPFEIVCTVRNTGSEPVADATVELRGEHLLMLEEYRYPRLVPELDVGETAVMRWEVLKQRRAVAPFEIHLAYDDKITVVTGSTLRHKPRDLDKPPRQNVSGARRWFSVGTSATRVVAHETDLGFGPLLVTSPLDKAVLGVLHQPAQLLLSDGQSFPLFAEMKKVGPRGVELYGSNDIAAWTISIQPELRLRGIMIEVALKPRKRIEMGSFEFGPFQTESSMIWDGTIANLILQSGQISLTWHPTIKNSIEITGSGEAGLLSARTKPQLFLPGVLYRASAVLCRPVAAIIRSA